MKYYSKNGNMVYAATWILRLCNRGGAIPLNFPRNYDDNFEETQQTKNYMKDLNLSSLLID